MHLLGSVDQEEEEGECASRNRGDVNWKRRDFSKELLQFSGTGIASAPSAARASQVLYSMECGRPLEPLDHPAQRVRKPANVFVQRKVFVACAGI